MFSAVLILMFLLTAVALVKANPVYPGELIMTREDMAIRISKVGGKMWAEVNGTYSFSVIMPPSPYPAVMYYPVPSDAEAISVKIDETPLDWTYNGTYYQTVVGNFPFIKWLISPVPNVFSIKTHYEHPVHIIDGNYTFLYALGTGRYLAELKSCDVYITVYMSKYFAPIEDIDVYLVTQKGVMEPANYAITSLDGMWKVTYVELQTWGLKDFLLTIKPHPAANFTWSPSIPKVGEPVTFDASSSSPGWNGTNEMPIVEYRWDFGDGNKTTTSTPTVYHSFSSSGIYYVTLTVYSPGATPETDSATLRIMVISVPVGGYSVPVEGYALTKALTLNLVAVAILVAAFITIKRKKLGKAE
jgi:PKD repeat protein